VLPTARSGRHENETVAGEMQLQAPKPGLVHNMGGLAVANYATVLGG
jgi:hypothetical protein